MIPKIVEVKPLEGYRLWVRFHDGTVGTVSLENELWGPVFEPLEDPGLFFKASVDPELKTVIWPNGADLAPDFLFHAAQHNAPADAP